MVGSVRIMLAAVKKMLEASVTYKGVNSRIYMPGDTISSQLPRIELNLTTPVENYAALGAGRAPVWKIPNIRVDVYSKSPAECDEVASYIDDAFGDNRNYNASTVTIDGSTVNTTGRFYMLRANGGTQAVVMQEKQQWHRSLSYTGRWLQTS